ncbi:hypothetical protein RFI_28643 [Reticulomyxa filosa]|uniref:Uncharacterized protein n=1 Tax=Reticulomyxa filosa TaxID=46433 RepID=X6M486_RETFI|nr:hypothetical protein RFI_28643 [Reticulomyxa filosa]|eukprot:ETO08744.1 hypothetical protein RFI_28643 [Reticulomyxa filosa]
MQKEKTIYLGKTPVFEGGSICQQYFFLLLFGKKKRAYFHKNKHKKAHHRFTLLPKQIKNRTKTKINAFAFRIANKQNGKSNKTKTEARACNETQEHNKKKLTKSQGWIGKKSCTQKNLCKSLSHKQRMSIITIIFILKIFSLNPDQFFFFSFFSHSLLCPSSSKRKKDNNKKLKQE